jgi:hypothetical protein
MSTALTSLEVVLLRLCAAHRPANLRDGEKIMAGRPMAALRHLHELGLVQRSRWALTAAGETVAAALPESPAEDLRNALIVRVMGSQKS